MMVALLNGIVWFFVLSPFVLALFLVPWSVADAKLRGKSPLLVSLAVVLFFPWGLLAWLVFRPDPIDPTNTKRPFRLDDYRVQ
jgi:hypothetical protein